MGRLRANFVRGVIDNSPLTDVGTTLESGDLADLPVVDGGDVAVLILDPAGIDGEPEIVHVTTHTSADSEATILRGQENTTAREHVSGIVWIHAPTADDFNSEFGTIQAQLDVDNPLLWGDDLGFDYEFERVTTDLPTGWEWINQNSSTYEESYGAGTLTAAVHSGDQHNNLLVRSLDGAPTAFEVVGKVTGVGVVGGNFRYGLVLADSATGKYVTFEIYRNTGWYINKWDDASTFAGFLMENGNMYGGADEGPAEYFKIVRNGTNDWDFYASNDGTSWYFFASDVDVDSFIVPDRVGFFGTAGAASVPAHISCHWLRLREAGGTPEAVSSNLPPNSRVAATGGFYNGASITPGTSWEIIEPTQLSLAAKAGDFIEATYGYLADNINEELRSDVGVTDEDGTTILRRVANTTRGVGSSYATLGSYIPITVSMGFVAQAEDIINGRINVALVSNTQGGSRKIFVNGDDLALTYALKNFGPS